MKKKISLKKAFTLIEVLLYLSLSSIIVLIIASMWVTVTETRDRSEAMSTVNAEGQQLINTITQVIRNANSINTPTTGASGTSLSLAMGTPAINPTIIALSGSNVTLTEGATPAVTLNSQRVTVGALTFRNLTRPASSGVVRIELTLNYVNTTGKPSLNYSETFYATASLR